MKKNQNKILISLKKARSTLDKVIDMIEQDKYCIHVIQQNLAAIGLIKSTNLQLLEDHLSCCFVDAAKSNDEARLNDMVQEVLTIVKTAQNK